MMRRHRILSVLLSCLAAAHAQAEIFSRVEANSGVTILTNVPVDAPTQGKLSRHAGTPGTPSSAVSPVSFPKIDGARQSQLDGERRDILQTELQDEQQALARATAHKEPNDVIRRHTLNVEALKRELARVP